MPITITGVDTGQISDGYHTFDELYEHRIHLYIALCRYIRVFGTATIWRSRHHSDGSFIEGWFVMGIFEKQGQQITYHLPDRCWLDTGFALTKDRAPDFDGHTSVDVISRLQRL